MPVPPETAGGDPIKGQEQFEAVSACGGIRSECKACGCRAGNHNADVRQAAGWLAEKTNPGQQRISARKNCPMIRIHAVRAAVPGTGESDFHADDQQRAVRTGSLPAEAKAAITAFQAHHQGVISGRYHL